MNLYNTQSFFFIIVNNTYQFFVSMSISPETIFSHMYFVSNGREPLYSSGVIFTSSGSFIGAFSHDSTSFEKVNWEIQLVMNCKCLFLEASSLSNSVPSTILNQLEPR